ncbi:MAG: serine/threonine protein kinase, partial [Deltaproteobacteria bacterium]|nr:serine/threonine protein kinase [Deltaproteobacteria bacterium]
MEPGDHVGERFWIGEQVGAGGMGVVYKALDDETEQPVALKVFTGRRDADIARARREAMAVAMLEHPNIVRHVASGLLPDGRLFLAMEWIEGLTVADRVDRAGFTLREAVATVRGLAAALAVAHDAGIVHRDVKPSNAILEGGDPARAKLIDFGVARFGTVATSLTLAGLALGTPGYMAPEQVRGELDLTPATDVFGLGVLFYECATGSYTFTGDHAAALMAKVLFADPQPLGARCPEAPPQLVRLADAMLRKEAHLRPADGAAVVAALDAIGPIPDGPRRQL